MEKGVGILTKLSVIIPYCNEYPQVTFTVQNILNELEGIDAEVITIANKSTDKGYASLSGAGGRAPPYVRIGKLKNTIYDDKLGHWCAKNHGLKIAKGKRILFLDSHVILKKNSIRDMMNTPCPGSLHMQIHYMMDTKALIYSSRPESMHYTFAGCPQGRTKPFNVPVMSTCGMMIEKKNLDHIGHWNTELGIYGGGENYMMYKIGTCGLPIQIHHDAALYHYADKRGYSWNYDDYVRNQFIAGYCVGAEEWLTKLVDMRKSKKNSNKVRLDEIANDVRFKCKDDRNYIRERQKCTLREYFDEWGGEFVR